MSCNVNCQKPQSFVSRNVPDWTKVDNIVLKRYQYELNVALNNIAIPYECFNICSVNNHNSAIKAIDDYYCSIV